MTDLAASLEAPVGLQAAVVGAGAVELWALRGRARFGGVVLGGTIALTAVWAWQLLDRTPDFVPGLGPAVAVVGVLVAIVLATPVSVQAHRTQLLAAALGFVILVA